MLDPRDPLLRAVDSAQLRAAEERVDRLLAALKFCRDIAEEELPYAKVGSGAEVALRHILRKANDNVHY